VAVKVASSSLQYGDLARKIQRRWIEDGWPHDGVLALSDPSEPSASGPARYEVSRDLLLAVADLVAGHAAVAVRNQANAQRLFEAVAGSTAAPTYAVRTWMALGGRRAHKLAHAHNRPADPDDEASLESAFSAFEAALLAIASRSYENMDDLDEILGSANR
jgi:hypothetical protein